MLPRSSQILGKDIWFWSKTTIYITASVASFHDSVVNLVVFSIILKPWLLKSCQFMRISTYFKKNKASSPPWCREELKNMKQVQPNGWRNRPWIKRTQQLLFFLKKLMILWGQTHDFWMLGLAIWPQPSCDRARNWMQVSWVPGRCFDQKGPDSPLPCSLGSQLQHSKVGGKHHPSS